MPYPPYSPDFTPSDVFFFLFPWMKKFLKVEHFSDVEEVKQKNGRSTKRHQNRQVQKLSWAVEKSLDRCITSNGESLKVTEV